MLRTYWAWLNDRVVNSVISYKNYRYKSIMDNDKKKKRGNGHMNERKAVSQTDDNREYPSYSYPLFLRC